MFPKNIVCSPKSAPYVSLQKSPEKEILHGVEVIFNQKDKYIVVTFNHIDFCEPALLNTTQIFM